ncbi:MAG: hypothetical protein KHW90_09765 [Clostridiales bacterium]|nr:hypothetical protein [Clostridiales bacterium]
MKRFAGMMGALLLMPTLALASSDMVSISELRQQVEVMGRWTQTYEAHGRTIEVDIPIYIPNEKELAVYDCSAYTEYIKNPNSDDKNNVYSYNENLRELTKENDGTSEADIEVYGKGTELRIMLNNPEDLLGKNKNDNIKIKEYGFYQYQVDDKVTYAENNEMSLEEAEKYLEEIVEYFIKDEYNGIDIDYIKIAGRGRKTKSYTDEELGEYVDYYPKGSYFFNYYQTLHKIPIMMTIIATLNNKQENKIYGDLFEYWGTTGGICQIMDRNAFWLTVRWMKVEKVHNEKVKLLPIEQIINTVEKEIKAGHVRNVYALKLGYIIYLNDRSPETYTLYPMWVLDCDYVENKNKEIKVNPYSDDIRDCFSFERICINPETAEMMDFLNPKTSMLYAP